MTAEQATWTERREWEVFLVDQDGFTERDDDRAVHILGMLPDLDAITREVGDSYPGAIIVARDTAKPTPQYAGSEFLREPTSYATRDRIEFDVSDADRETALTLWRAAQGAAEALNTGEDQTVTRG